jgi:exopolysaccharide production protein ExoQ
MSGAEWNANRWQLVLAGCLVAVVFMAVRMDQAGGLDGGSLDDLDQLHSSVNAGSSARRAAYLVLGIAGAVGLLRPGGSTLRVRGPLAVLGCALVAWCSLSVCWSDEPSLGLRRLSAFAAVLVAALAVVKRFSWREILLVGLGASGAQFAGSLMAAIAAGTFRPWEGGYRFSGLLHPNHEAINCAVLLFSAFFLARDAKRAKLPLYLVALTALGFLLLARSRTSLVAALAGCALTCWSVAPRHVRLPMVFAAAAAACLACVVLGGWILDNSDRVIQLGREGADASTLVGRIPLWQELLPYAWNRPLAGYGYNAFWTPLRIDTLADSQGWAISHAHNDYLDVFLGAGVVGLGLYAALLVGGIRTATACARNGLEPGVGGLPVWPWFAAIGGFTEGIGHQNYLFQFMLIASLAYVALRPDEACATGGLFAGAAKTLSGKLPVAPHAELPISLSQLPTPKS